MLNDEQIWELAERMNVPLVFCNFKDKLKNKKLKYNASYIVNMEDSVSKDGKKNPGSHYVCFQINKYPNGTKESIYFDSFGMPQPDTITEYVGGIMPHNDKDIQSLMNSACGWYCLAFLHYINSYHGRVNHLYTDAKHFIDLFDDLEKEHNHLKNEWVLKHFFRSADPALRKPISVGGEVINTNDISDQNDDNKQHL
jgi:hypothetical protein